MIELSECGTVKLFAVVYCDFFGYAEVAYNVLPEKLLKGSGRDIPKRLGFDPFREIIHCDCCILEVAWSCWEGSHNVDAPSCEGPDRRYEVDFFWRELAVMGVLLTIWARAYDFMGVRHGRRPIKPFAKGFSHQSPCSHVRKAHAFVYFLQQLPAFSLRDAL